MSTPELTAAPVPNAPTAGISISATCVSARSRDASASRSTWFRGNGLAASVWAPFLESRLAAARNQGAIVSPAEAQSPFLAIWLAAACPTITFKIDAATVVLALVSEGFCRSVSYGFRDQMRLPAPRL
jgi:hypothetical protein